MAPQTDVIDVGRGASVQRLVWQNIAIYEMARMHAATAPRRHEWAGYASRDGDGPARWCNSLWHTRRLLSPKDRRVVSPNNDTLYTNAWLDLKAGPVVLHIPDMGDRYWTLGLLDMRSNPFCAIGPRMVGTGHKRVLVAPVDWSGECGITVDATVRAPGHDLWMIGRILVDATGGDLARVHALQDKFAITDAHGGTALRSMNTWLHSHRDPHVPTAQMFREVCDEVVRRNPDAAEPHAPWPDDGVLGDVLRQTYETLRSEHQPTDLGGGWFMPTMVRSSYGDNYRERAWVAVNLIGALGVDEAMYVTAEVDASGAPLSGQHKYVLHLTPDTLPQVDAFWSLTMYRRSDCLLVDNAIARYSIGDRTQQLSRDPDGGLKLYLQADIPADEKARVNWLPAPHDNFYVTLRLYWPSDAHLDRTFRYAPVQRVD